jgi:thiamine biosynthesis lipoprotein ApbE
MNKQSQIQKTIDELVDKVKRLEAQNQELVEALEQITKVEYQSPVTMYQAMEDIAKAALAKARRTE